MPWYEQTSVCWGVPRAPSPQLLDRLKRRAGAQTAWTGSSADGVALLRRDRVARPTFFVGTGTCGLGAGARRTVAALRSKLDELRVEGEVVEVGCVGLCSEEPIVDVQMPGRARLSFGRVGAVVVSDVVEAVLQGRVPADRVLGQYRHEALEPYHDAPILDEHPFFASQSRWVLANCGLIDPGNVDEYVARGGYSSLERSLREQTPEEVCEVVLKSGLRGRGGGGFPAGLKWQLARKSAEHHRTLICNADEGDPGAFMDRAVAEGDPHRLIEGMAIAAYAIGAMQAHIYIRAEYPLAVERLMQAIAQARELGLLGPNILGSGFALDISIKMGAGAFVCGEETALIHSLEGKRGMPRPRPPYPAERGLFDKPTVINNVETLANVPALMTMGASAFRVLGTQSSPGTKVFALSGMTRRTGLVEIAMGTPLRDIVYRIGGGISGGRRCKAVQIGGPSGGCIPEQHLDVPTDYEALKDFGAIMGSGGLVVLDESTCMVDLAKYFMEFIQSESCGKCIPCREGTRRMLEILQAITRPRRREEGVDALLRFQGAMALEELGEVIRSTSLCGLGQSAPNPVLGTLRWFRDEYEAHIFDRRCPAGSCKELVGAPCQTGCPVGTEVWRYVAHVSRGEFEQAYAVIREANPFPSVCARVCHHPCERVCRSGTAGSDPIAVRGLKRFVVDHVEPSSYTVEVVPAGDRSRRVAIVGAGPAGLTAAHLLSIRGHRVTLFERQSEPGGMLLSGIPAYRLPRDVLGEEIAQLLNENIELRCGVTLGREVTVDSLSADFDAVYLALGAHRSQRLGLEGEDVQGVWSSMEFLEAHNLRGQQLAYGRVAVIGGGNSALDAARVAIRQRGVRAVVVLYRRTEGEMPAFGEEIEAALKEGVELVTLVAPIGILRRDGHVRGLRLIRNTLGATDASGRRRPVPVAGSEFEMEFDSLVVAIGEQPEVDGLAALGTTRRGTLDTHPESMVTGKRGVFAGGDLIRGPSTVIEAIADGKRAAKMIEQFLDNKQLRTFHRVKLPTVYVPLAEGNGEEETTAPRVCAPHLPLERRLGSFDEVEQCISLVDAVREAKRCLRCDLEFTRRD